MRQQLDLVCECARVCVRACSVPACVRKWVLLAWAPGAVCAMRAPMHTKCYLCLHVLLHAYVCLYLGALMVIYLFLSRGFKTKS